MGFDFQYFISEKNGFVVASLVGMLEHSCVQKLDQLNLDIMNSQFKKVVINFRDVSMISPESIPAIAKLQKIVREREADLRLCGLKPEVREKLSRAGILRPHEIADNLQSALQSLVSSVIKKVS